MKKEQEIYNYEEPNAYGNIITKTGARTRIINTAKGEDVEKIIESLNKQITVPNTFHQTGLTEILSPEEKAIDPEIPKAVETVIADIVEIQEEGKIPFNPPRKTNEVKVTDPFRAIAIEDMNIKSLQEKVKKIKEKAAKEISNVNVEINKSRAKIRKIKRLQKKMQETLS